MSGSENHPDDAVPPSVPSGGRFTFELTERVPLGTPDKFLQWVNGKFDAQIPNVNDLAAQVPGPLQALVTSLLGVTITIDALRVETGPDAHYRFAASVDFAAAPVRVGSFLEIDRIGFRIASRKAAAAVPAR